MEESSTIGYDLQVGYEIEVTASIPDIPLEGKTTIPPPFTRAWSESKTVSKAASGFVSKSGMVSIAKGICMQYQVELNDYELPAFTVSFNSAIKDLFSASKENAVIQKAKFKSFIQNYGTHFMKRVQFGSSFMQRSTYSGNIRRKMDADILQECNSKKGFEYYGMQLEEDATKCSNTSKSSLYRYRSSDFETKTIIKGALPTDIEHWTTQMFTAPVPLKYNFAPIVNLFRIKIVDARNIKSDDGSPVKAADINKWFVPLYHDYCNTMGINCTIPKGCGYDDECPLDAICDPTSTVHHCTSRN